MTATMPLRARNRLNAMLTIQDSAYTLFAEHGYDEVTVAQIAAHAGVGPATVYRHFGSKERIVMWNEHDDEIARLVVRRIRSQPPFEALRSAFVDDVADLLDDDRHREQMRLLCNDPVLGAAAATLDVELNAAVAGAICDANPAIGDLEASVVARAALGALDAALAEWQKSPRRTRLADVVADAFAALESLG